MNLAGAINAIKGAWVHGYFAETVNTESAKIAYPSGYTRGNCFVVTGYMNYGGQQKYTIPNHVTAVQDYDDGLTVYHTVASYNRQQVFLLLRKF